MCACWSRSLSTLLVCGAVTPPVCGGHEGCLNEGGQTGRGAQRELCRGERRDGRAQRGGCVQVIGELTSTYLQEEEDEVTPP